jgi:hypothetical protein
MTCDNCGIDLSGIMYFVQDEQHAYLCRACWQEALDAWRAVLPEGDK